MLYALLGAVLIGITLGLLGSGGSILTVPVLVYLAHQPDKVAIAESLAIVGGIALVAAVPYARQRSVDVRSGLLFGVPGVVGTYGGAALAAWVPGSVQLALFAGVMLVAAVLMVRGRAGLGGTHRRQAAWKILLEGTAVGVLTGLVGVGGGFLIVPALVLLGGLPMRLAVGTSLLIIAAKSFAGFIKYLDVLGDAGLAVDWRLIGLFTSIGIVGSFAGNHLSRRVPQAALQRGFAAFLVVMGVFILWREVPGALRPPPDAPRTAAVALVTPHQPSPAMSFLDALLHRTAARPDPTRLTPAEFLQRRQPHDLVLDVRTPPE